MVNIAVGTATSDDPVRLLLVRHAESEANAEDALSTAMPGPPITVLGADQAADLGLDLRWERISGIYTSTLLRARQTAAHLARSVRVEPVELDGLREVEAGDEEGAIGAAALGRYLAPVARWVDGDLGAVIRGGYDGFQFLDRFDTAVGTILARHAPGDTVAVISHSVAIRVWVGSRAANASPAFTSTASLDNCSVVEVLAGRGFELARWQDRPAVGGRFEA